MYYPYIVVARDLPDGTQINPSGVLLAYAYLPGYAIYLDVQSLRPTNLGVGFRGVPTQKLTPKPPNPGRVPPPRCAA